MLGEQVRPPAVLHGLGVLRRCIQVCIGPTVTCVKPQQHLTIWWPRGKKTAIWVVRFLLILDVATILVQGLRGHPVNIEVAIAGNRLINDSLKASEPVATFRSTLMPNNCRVMQSGSYSRLHRRWATPAR